MPSHSFPRPSNAPPHWGWLVALALIIAALRLWQLDADPPLWMPDATAMDEGLWADGARGKHHFDDWFADDTGNAFLAAPLYNGMVYASYSALGPSLWSTRLVSALCSLLLLGLVYVLSADRLGRKDGMLIASLTAICPFLWAQSRFALTEVPQATAITASVLLLFGGRTTGVARALGAGVCMAVAIGIKPNAVVFGVAPLAVAWICRWWVHCAAHIGRPHRDHIRDGLAVILGGAAGLGALAAWAWLPNLDALLATWKYEGGVGRSGLGDHLLRLGFWGSREAYPGTHAIWAPLRSAPLICMAGWLYGIWTVLRWGWSGRPIHRRIEPWEWPILAWCVVTFVCAEFSFQQVARRTIHLIVPMAILGGTWWVARREHLAEMVGLIVSHRRHVTVRAALWALLTWPLAVAAKPTVCNSLRGWGAQWTGVSWQDATLAERTAAAGATGLAYLGAWLAAVLLLTFLASGPQRFASRALTRLAPTVLLLLAITEAFLLARHLVAPTYSILEAQAEAQEIIPDGDVVFGTHASLLLLDRPVRTIRWVQTPDTLDYYSGPRPNPDAFERLAPQFVITATARPKREPEYRDLVDGQGPDGERLFEPLRALQYIIEPPGYGRFVLSVYRRNP